MSPSSNRRRNPNCGRYDCTNKEPHIGHTVEVTTNPPLGNSEGPHLESHMFPGMEHARNSGVSVPDGMHLESTPPRGPSRQDRVTALKFAVELCNHNDYRLPIAASMEAAEQYANFLYDGTVKKDDGGDVDK